MVFSLFLLISTIGLIISKYVVGVTQTIVHKSFSPFQRNVLRG